MSVIQKFKINTTNVRHKVQLDIIPIKRDNNLRQRVYITMLRQNDVPPILQFRFRVLYFCCLSRRLILYDTKKCPPIRGCKYEYKLNRSNLRFGNRQKYLWERYIAKGHVTIWNFFNEVILYKLAVHVELLFSTC